MKTSKWVIAVGNPFDGITLYGPFDDYPDKELEEMEDDTGWISELKEWS